MLPPYPHPAIHSAPDLKTSDQPGVLDQRSMAIELLHKAYRLILIDEEDFICCAISEAVDNRSVAWEIAGNRMKDWIRLMLVDYSTLEGWLRDTHDVDIEDTPEYLDAIQETRLRWIEGMIAKLEG